MDNSIKLMQARDAYTTNDCYMAGVVDKASALSFCKEPVLIVGETGTGKELIANILHGANDNNLVTVNTTAVTDTLFESELFGHVKGSFTGAFRDRDGLVEHANGGTLFLDEIGDMPVNLQAKILRLIQFGTYRIVGDNETRHTDCRIIAATCANLDAMIVSGAFRKDLFYRLSTFMLTCTPLRERRHDAIKFITEHPTYKDISADDSMAIVDHVASSRLEGNYRELEQIMLRYKVLKELPC